MYRHICICIGIYILRKNCALFCREMKMFVIPKINVFLVRERDCRKSEGYSIFLYFLKNYKKPFYSVLEQNNSNGRQVKNTSRR